MPGRKREPSFQLASGTTNERDNSYNISSTLGSIFYNTDTSNVEVYHEDPSNNVGWRDLVMNNKEQIDISGNFDISGNVDIRNNLSVGGNSQQFQLLAGAGALNGTGGSQGTATSTSEFSSDYTAVKAFNGALHGAGDAWHNQSSTLPTELDFEFPYAVIVTEYKIWPRGHPTHNGTNGEGPSDWALQGSNDGTTFVDIDSRSGQNDSPASGPASIKLDLHYKKYTVDNSTNAYTHIRLDISGSQKSSGVVSIGEIAYYGYIDGAIAVNALAVDSIVSSGMLPVHGNVNILGPSPDFIPASPEYKLSVNGRIHVNGANGIHISRGDLYQSPTERYWRITNTTNYLRFEHFSTNSGTHYAEGNMRIHPGNGVVHSSDDRIKKNEKLIVNATETLSKLTPQIYDKYLNMNLSGKYQIESGLIAQEVYYNAPELRHLVLLGEEIDASGNEYTPTPEEMDLSGVDIGSDPDYSSHGWSKTEHSSLNYRGLIAYLIKSNQELVGRIDSLKTDISAIMTHLDL